MVDGCSWVRQQTRCRHPPRLLHAGARPRLRQLRRGEPRRRGSHPPVRPRAHALARKHWRSSGARNEAEARSWWVSHCRMRIGVATARAYACCHLKRFGFVGHAPSSMSARSVAWPAGPATLAPTKGGAHERRPPAVLATPSARASQRRLGPPSGGRAARAAREEARPRGGARAERGDGAHHGCVWCVAREGVRVSGTSASVCGHHQASPGRVVPRGGRWL